MAEATVFTLRYPECPPKVRMGWVYLPHAEIEVAATDDGRFCWGMKFATRDGGEGFAALEKWGYFASSREDAVRKAAAYMLHRLEQRWARSATHTKALVAWAESLSLPKQQELFE